MLMKKVLLVVLMMMFASALTFAQSRKISGKLSDKETGESVIQATVQLLKTDSSFVKGTLSNMNGEFSMTAPSNGKYILKINSIGYKSIVKDITISGGKDVSLGSMSMGPDAIMLKGVVATGQASKVTVREDTFVYNAEAFRLPEGSVLEELVKKLPGAEVDDEGNI